MLIRFAEFHSDLPNDQIEENGEIVQAGGQGVAQAIAQIFKRLDYGVTEPSYDEHGWSFFADTEGRALNCQVTDLGDHLIFAADDVTNSKEKRSTRESATLADAVKRLDAELKRDGRFHNIEWYRHVFGFFSTKLIKDPVNGEG